MFEKEIKILNIDKEQVIKKIQELFNITKIETFNVCDIYLINKKDKKLKIRLTSNSNQFELIQKTIKKKTFAKNAIEKNKYIDAIKFKDYIKKYWQKSYRVKKKQRTYMNFKDIHFMIDEYPWFPPLLEIEAKSDKLLKSLISKLNLQTHTILNCWYNWLQRHYKKQILPI